MCSPYDAEQKFSSAYDEELNKQLPDLSEEQRRIVIRLLEKIHMEAFLAGRRDEERWQRTRNNARRWEMGMG